MKGDHVHHRLWMHNAQGLEAGLPWTSYVAARQFLKKRDTALGITANLMVLGIGMNLGSVYP